MDPPGTLREQFLALARRLPEFAECDPAEVLVVVLRCDGVKLRLRIDPATMGAAHTDLSPCEQAVLRACTVEPKTVKRLAREAGYSVGRTGEAVTRLTSLNPPLLIRVHGGVRLP